MKKKWKNGFLEKLVLLTKILESSNAFGVDWCMLQHVQSPFIYQSGRPRFCH